MNGFELIFAQSGHDILCLHINNPNNIRSVLQRMSNYMYMCHIFLVITLKSVNFDYILIQKHHLVVYKQEQEEGSELTLELGCFMFLHRLSFLLSLGPEGPNWA